jgi:hypothetical protein
VLADNLALELPERQTKRWWWDLGDVAVEPSDVAVSNCCIIETKLTKLLLPPVSRANRRQEIRHR